MKKSSFLVLIVFVVFCNLSHAQHYPKHTVGTGILLGAGSFNSLMDYTFGFGLKADYQRNLAPWFSLRFETAFLQNLESSDYRTYGPNEFYEYTSRPNALSFGISPLFYGRYEKFDFFVGAQLGAAYAATKQTISSALYNENNELITKYQELPQFSDWTIGVNPIVGFNFSVGNRKRPSGEFEVAFAMNRWLQEFYLFQDNPPNRPIDYRFIHAQLTYRFILK